MRKSFLFIFILLLLLNPASSSTIAGWLYHENCNSFGCLLYGWTPIAILENEGQVVKASVIKATDKTVEDTFRGTNLGYAGHIFDHEGHLYLIAIYTDCLGDNSYQECLIVSKFSPDGTLEGLKTFYSNYRQTDPTFTLVENSMFTIKQISTYNGYLEILLDYPKKPMVLIIDPQLNIAKQIAIPWIDGQPPELNSIGGRWVAINNRTLIDIASGKYYNLPPNSLYISKVYDTPSGPIVFYSSYTGFYGSSTTYIKQYRLTNSSLILEKTISLSFSGYGFPGFLKISRTSSGWLAYLSLWKNFGGDISYGILKADSEMSNFKFYTIKGSYRNGWPHLDNETGMFPIEECPLSDQSGELYLSLSLDGASAIVSLNALPLEESPIEAIVNTSLNSTITGNETQLDPVDYIVECSNCKQFEVVTLTDIVPLSVVKKPGMFYGVGTTRSGTYRTDFFCYAPVGYKAYCGFLVDGRIYIFDATSGLVEFNPEKMDEYHPLTNIDVPHKLLSVDLCTGYYNTPTLPGVKAQLIDLWIPENMSLSEAVSSGAFDFTIIPWEAPDCE